MSLSWVMLGRVQNGVTQGHWAGQPGRAALTCRIREELRGSLRRWFLDRQQLSLTGLRQGQRPGVGILSFKVLWLSNFPVQRKHARRLVLQVLPAADHAWLAFLWWIVSPSWAHGACLFPRPCLFCSAGSSPLSKLYPEVQAWHFSPVLFFFSSFCFPRRRRQFVTLVTSFNVGIQVRLMSHLFDHCFFPKIMYVFK